MRLIEWAGSRAAWVLPMTAMMIPLSAGHAESYAAASRTPGSSTTAISLDITRVAAVGQSAFTGTQGTAESHADARNDAADVDGIGAFVRTRDGRAKTAFAPPSSEAATELNALTLELNSAASRPLFTLTTLRNSARCAPPGDPRVSSSLSGAAVLGTAIDPGTTEVAATGAQLGYKGIGRATLTVDLRKEATSADLSASARTILEVGGRLHREDGTLAYDGPLAELRLGDVDATCEPVVRPSSTSGSSEGGSSSGGSGSSGGPGTGSAGPSAPGSTDPARAGSGQGAKPTTGSSDRDRSGANGSGQRRPGPGHGTTAAPDRAGAPGGHGRPAAAPGAKEDSQSVDARTVPGTTTATPVRSSWPLALVLFGLGISLAFLYWRRNSRP